MSEREYRNAAQERVIRVMFLLGGNEFHGLSPGEIAKSLGISPSNVTRDLAVLKFMGVAEQVRESGRWCLGPKLNQLALGFQQALGRSQNRVDEIRQRYTRLP